MDGHFGLKSVTLLGRIPWRQQHNTLHDSISNNIEVSLISKSTLAFQNYDIIQKERVRRTKFL